MRKTFYAEFVKQDAYLLYDDVGYGIIDQNNLRCVNVGVPEQAMVGMAAGMASCGAKVYCYFIAPHIYRAWDMVRNLVVYKNRDVTLVGVGVDDEYAYLGYSHTASYSEMDKSCDAIGLRYFQPTTKGGLTCLMSNTGPMFLHLTKGG